MPYIRRFRLLQAFFGLPPDSDATAMGLLDRLREWIVGDDDQRVQESREAAEPTAETADRTSIADAEATSLRAIKLPDAERDALDADEREP